VAYAPSNVKDAAVGKSFTFIAIVMRNAMGTLMRAASAIVPTLAFEIGVLLARILRVASKHKSFKMFAHASVPCIPQAFARV
jgi:hypothetical protein